VSAMQPSEALSTAAQVSVTLAGFAGIVVVFRSGALHEWSTIDKLRLRILLTNSVLPLVLSFIGMLLLSANVPGSIAWRCGSGLAVALLFAMGRSYSRSFQALSREQLRDPVTTRLVFYIGGGAGTIVMILQFCNLFWLGVFWPFLLAITTLIVAAIVQFVRMVILHE